MIGTALEYRFSLTHAWETVPAICQRLGLTTPDGLTSWLVEQVNAGHAEASDMQDAGGWVVPIFRLVLRQPTLF